jgi:hypothetical protein
VAEKTGDPRELDSDLALERLAGTEQKMPAGDLLLPNDPFIQERGFGHEDLRPFGVAWDS